ncbi:hypothetical protein BABINDRAFT_100031 [Babjeviella inositovora NRRL Y-12698]|uniref:Uncharacterized protein n=1 Tax=Babjeviella inositovora NRRL Y-12698 TaxID=984486 RepID=A0A1E3QIM8_9ASCO|nr:uncharacterized protein BABINDRAFT_100031 [Babjeviella inositovora NRRL Y-12698]ODQ77304.1 hypothetical protein BABINDRAFT_100031 [Babjeviella inositovora NRRL Y-12698]
MNQLHVNLSIQRRETYNNLPTVSDSNVICKMLETFKLSGSPRVLLLHLRSPLQDFDTENL